MKTRNSLRKLSRIELVELIYDLRRDNVTLEKRVEELESQLDEIQSGPEAEMREKLEGIEDLLQKIRSSQLASRRRPGNAAEDDGWKG